MCVGIVGQDHCDEHFLFGFFPSNLGLLLADQLVHFDLAWNVGAERIWVEINSQVNYI